MISNSVNFVSILTNHKGYYGGAKSNDIGERAGGGRDSSALQRFRAYS